MSEIKITEKPRLVNPSDVIGKALDIPLNTTPDQRWLRHFKAPADRMEVKDHVFRAWLTREVRGDVSAFLDKLQAAIDAANKASAQDAEAARVRQERHRRLAMEQENRLSDAVEQWWSEHDPTQGSKS